MDIQIALIGLLQAAMVAIIGGYFARDAKKKKAYYERQDKRAHRRAQESRMAMELASANVGLSIVTATAVRDGKTNGIMEAALKNASEANHTYNAFLLGIAAEEVA